MYTLYIGNKNYSSWSLRGWLATKLSGAPFREVLVQLQGVGPNPAHASTCVHGRTRSFRTLSAWNQFGTSRGGATAVRAIFFAVRSRLPIVFTRRLPSVSRPMASNRRGLRRPTWKHCWRIRSYRNG